ncbi:A/G-specific adenine glycosylase [Natronogracilivirga saccharolytica]
MTSHDDGKKPSGTPEPDIAGLISWYHRFRREMPWRNTSDPYLIWISEIMLQQTRVDQALPYYERFTKRYPDAASLASSGLDEVLRLWEGLGYYSRARNMHKAAKQIVDEHDGSFPTDYQDVISLRGVGPYTAAAVMSIAFNYPAPVVDGNVMRVISRLYHIEDDIRLQSTRDRIEILAADLLDRARPGTFNQAVMELGATICTPRSPACHDCPLQNSCQAYHRNRTGDIPYKSPAKKRPHHHIAVGVIRDANNRMLISRRPENAMLGGLWEFPGGKQEPGESLRETVKRELNEELGVRVMVEKKPFEVIRHAYSHFTITLHAFFAELDGLSENPEARNGEPVKWVAPGELVRFAFPKANRKITEKLVSYRAK